MVDSLWDDLRINKDKECVIIPLVNIDEDDDEDIQNIVDAAEIGYQGLEISDDEEEEASHEDEDENQPKPMNKSFLTWKPGAGKHLRALYHSKSDSTKKRKKAKDLALKRDAKKMKSLLVNKHLPVDNNSGGTTTQQQSAPEVVDMTAVDSNDDGETVDDSTSDDEENTMREEMEQQIIRRRKSLQHVADTLMARADHLLQHNVARNTRAATKENVLCSDMYKGLAVASYIYELLDGKKAWDAASNVAKFFYCHELLLPSFTFLQPDFAAGGKEWLEEVIASKGHKIIFFPKYHCELNYIEMVWAYIKTKIRAECTNSLDEMHAMLIQLLQHVPLSYIRKVERRCFRFMHGYQLNMSGPMLDYAMKTYTSHRMF